MGQSAFPILRYRSFSRRHVSVRHVASALALLVAAIGANEARANEPVSFEGKTATMLVGYATGGGTDASARTLVPFLTKYLPGNPAFVVNNLPGADGMIAMNSFVLRTKPDGLTVTMGSSTSSDPLQYRRPQSRFDPTQFKFIGGLGRGGTILVIRKDAEKRLHDKSLPPVIMGSLGGVPRSGMQSAAWGIAYLGWNAKWVVGYRGTKDLFVALERGEIDMTSTGNLGDVQRLLDDGHIKILTQSGTIQNGKISTRPEFGDAPVLASLVEDKIKSRIEKQSFAYWENLTSIDKWLALPPVTPEPIVAAYRAAYVQMVNDPDFIARGQRLSEDVVPQSAAEVKHIIDALGATPVEATQQIGVMLRKQGLDTE